MITGIIVIAILVIGGMWVVSVQRQLVSKEEMCFNSMSQIGVQQSSRWDALTAIVELVRSYNEHEYNTLRDIIAVRKGINGKSTAADVDGQEDAIKSCLGHINVVAEQYPELKANDNYREALQSVNTYENQVRMSRMVYNDSVTVFNRIVRQFPSSFVAGMFGFAVKDYLKVEAGKTAMPSMKI